MTEGVIADRVAGFHDFACEVRSFSCVLADQEECGVYIVFCQDFEQVKGVRIVRTVIVGKRQLLRTWWQADEGSSIPLAGRGHGLITGGNGSAHSGDRGEGAEHREIVNASRKGRIENATAGLTSSYLSFLNSDLAVNLFLNCAPAVVALFCQAKQQLSEPMANLFELPRYIAVEGPIRVGKSTLARILAERLNAQRVMEEEDNPFLRAFYDGERGAGFQAQFAFLIRRFEQLRGLDLGPRSQRTVVTDFIFEKDKLFACLNLTDQELDTYNRYYNHFREQLPTPDLVIYLQATPEVLKKRLKKKNAPGEKAVSEAYLEEVIKAYEHFFFHYTSSDLLIVNTSEIDFVERNDDLQELLRKVSEPIRGTQYFLPLGNQEAASA